MGNEKENLEHRKALEKEFKDVVNLMDKHANSTRDVRNIMITPLPTMKYIERGKKKLTSGQI